MVVGGQQVFRNEGWTIRTTKGPIIGDKDTDEYRRVLSALVLPEMVFGSNRVELVHDATGTILSFNALDALAGWKLEDLPPLQVRVAEEWRKAREVEIQQQKAVQLTYDWTFTTPYTCTVVAPAAPYAAPADGAPGPRCLPDHLCGPAHTRSASMSTSLSRVSAGSAVASAAAVTAAQLQHAANAQHAQQEGAGASGAGPVALPAAEGQHAEGGDGGAGVAAAVAAAASTSPCGCWVPTSEQIDRGLLMERDPILFYDEVPLYESDLDDNGVCALTVKLRVMPRCWLVLLRLWVRVDGSMVRLRETRLFCRHDKPEKQLEVLQEVKHCEGLFTELRKRGAPDEGPSYADADAASQVFQAVAPIGLTLLQTRKLTLPLAQ